MDKSHIYYFQKKLMAEGRLCCVRSRSSHPKLHDVNVPRLRAFSDNLTDNSSSIVDKKYAREEYKLVLEYRYLLIVT